jgi:hypothetical protein
VESRLKTYYELTEPLVGYYLKKGILKEIDGTGSTEKIYSKIKQTLNDVPT